MTQWNLEEPGWFTSDLGGICLEEDGGWYFYPKNGDWVGIPYGPRFNHYKKAQAYAEYKEGCL